MQRTRAIMKWGISLINPERLWMHYSFALLTIFGLLVTIHFVSDALVRQSDFSAETIDASSSLVILSQQILLLALDSHQADSAAFNQLTELTRQFETIHLTLLQGEIWSDSLQDHYFGGANSLNSLIREFADLTNRLTIYPPNERHLITSRLQELHGPMGLFNSLRESAHLIDAESKIETDNLQRLLNTVLIISGVTLVAEALAIFLPAQLTVKSVINELRNKTDVLYSSQNQLRRMNDQLHHIANHDPLTGLPNRACMATFVNNLQDTGSSVEVGVLFVGLDGFKTINDTIGHENGDLLLIAVAERLQKCVDEDDLVARIGGDEFFLTTTEPPENLAKRILATLGEPFANNGRSIGVSSSIGYLSAGTGCYDPDQILGKAAIALHAAKNSGGRQAFMYSDALGEDVAMMRQLQLELRDAIETGQIEPWFQPQVNLADGSLHGAEVLARWRHPTRGLLTPDKFLPAAERAGLIIELDHAIWNAAIGCAGRWQADMVWRPKISLNAAPDTIADPYLIEKLLKQIHQTALEADQVIVEVLETTLIESSDDMAAINIDGLAECGVSLELDDFGTGYASLSKLTQLPLAGIKLDRSLIAPLPAPGADSVVRAILALAVELGLNVVAEGIEETQQAEHLNACGCGVGQGYGFARPMPSGDFDKWLKVHAHQKLVAGKAA